MRKRFAFVGVASALLSLVPLGLGGGNSAQAMTCVADPPIDTACSVVFSVVYTACTGDLRLPRLPIATSAAEVGWPIDCPPLG